MRKTLGALFSAFIERLKGALSLGSRISEQGRRPSKPIVVKKDSRVGKYLSARYPPKGPPEAA